MVNQVRPKPGVFPHMMRWAAILGFAGFISGFFGPMIFRPDANQGPMLGIFITGPLGVLVGALFGLIKWIKRDD